jgi:hypothetical protein
MLPEYEQARKAVWNTVNPNTGIRRIDEAFPKELRDVTREQEMFIRFKNGSTWQLAGSDNYNNLVGTSYAGIVHSEYAIANPAAQSHFMPILIENNGWQILITTPRGRNHAHAMFRFAADEAANGNDWYAELSPASKTGALNPRLLEGEMRRLQALHGEQFGKALYLQEYECSFDAAIPGSVFGEWIEKARAEGRIGVVPIEWGVPVNTAWDLGRTDATAIWFFQVIFGDVRVVDYHEDNLRDIPHYVKILREKKEKHGWEYGTHYLPSDAKAGHLSANDGTVHQQLVRAEIGQVVRQPRHAGLQNEIQAARAMWPRVWMDEPRCRRGLDALTNYHYEWNDEAKLFTPKPEHDWSSHASTAFCLMGLYWVPEKSPSNRDAPFDPAQAQRGSIAGMKFSEVMKNHARHKRNADKERFTG